MIYLKEFPTIADANTQGAAGLASPHVDIVHMNNNVTVNIHEDELDIFNCSFDNTGKLVMPVNGTINYNAAAKITQFDNAEEFGVGLSLVSHTFADGTGIVIYYPRTNLTMVSDSALRDCDEMTYIFFPTCRVIGNNAFNYCESLESISFPLCEEIGMNAFDRCRALDNISFPRCTKIKDGAFRNCESLRTLYLGPSMCDLDSTNAFNGTRITATTGSIYVPMDLVSAYKSANNWSYFSSRFIGV